MQHMGRKYHIGNIAKMLDVSQRTIRYYEELGLIAAERTEGGFREFDENQVEKLRMILSLKELGMSLEEINKLIHLRQHGATGAEVTPLLLEHLKERAAEFENKIEKYKQGVAELKSAIEIISGCTRCKNPAEEVSCEKCVDERTHHHVPPLMKTLL